MSKRILAVSNQAFMLGGGEHSFLDLLFHLPPQWHVLAVIPEEGELALRLKSKGIPPIILPLPPIKPWYAKDMLVSLKAFKKAIERYRPHLIYANGPRALLYGGIAARLCAIPVIWHCRISERDIWLDPILPRISNYMIANSQATAKRFKTPYQKKIEVIHNGIDLTWFQETGLEAPPLIQPDWNAILSVARVSRSKRQDLVLAAFDHIAQEDDHCHLIVIGSKDPRDPGLWMKLQERSLHSPFSKRIHWVDHQDDLRPWYRYASLLIMASENEAFGRVLVEAMACGLPVVAARSGGIPEIVRHGEDGLLTMPGNASELAGAALRILSDEALRSRLSQSAQQRAKSFSLNMHVGKMVELFEQLVSSGYKK